MRQVPRQLIWNVIRFLAPPLTGCKSLSLCSPLAGGVRRRMMFQTSIEWHLEYQLFERCCVHFCIVSDSLWPRALTLSQNRPAGLIIRELSNENGDGNENGKKAIGLGPVYLKVGQRIREVTCGGSPHLSCKRDQIKMRDYMGRRVTPPKRVTSPTWVPPTSMLTGP